MYAVAIVDDQPVRRGGMERLVLAAPHLELVASVGGVDQLDRGGAGADVVVLDLPRPADASALSLIGRVARVSRPVVVSAWEQSPSLLAAARAGARGCVSRRCDAESVADALTTVAHGGFYVCGSLDERFRAELLAGTAAVDRSPAQGAGQLAPREVETLRFIARGFTQAQIAVRMGLSEATVNTYAKRIRAKLNATNKAELTRRAIELGHLADAQPVG